MRGKLLSTELPVILAGEDNVMLTELDVSEPKRRTGDALSRPELGGAHRQLVEEGCTDALRTLNLDERMYTFWDYFRDVCYAALRLDQLPLAPPVAERLKDAGVDRHVRAWANPANMRQPWIVLK